MSDEQIAFCLIPKDKSDELCYEFSLQQENLFSEYRYQPSIQIPNTTPPNVCGDVRGGGNCLYRQICLSISGSERSYMELRHLTAVQLNINRRNFVYIPEKKIQ